MSMIRPMASNNLLGSLNLLRRYMAHRVHNPFRYLETSTFKHGHCFSTNQRPTSSSDVHLDAGMENKQRPPALRPPKPKFPTWARWALGSILSLFLPFWKKKWGKLVLIQDEVVKVAEVVEDVADVVEAVAEVTENIASEVADNLPDDGKLKNAVTLVGQVSKEAAKDAQLAKEFFHKVDDLKQEVETLVDPIVDPEKLKEK